MKELGIDLGLLISQVVNFGLLLFVLSLVLFKPILKKLEERAARVRKGIEDSEEAERLRQEAEEHYQEEMDKSRIEARQVIERATRTAEQQRQEILAQARSDAHELLGRAQDQATRQRQERETEWRQQIVDLAIAAASRLLQEDLDDERHHALVHEFLDQTEQLQ